MAEHLYCISNLGVCMCVCFVFVLWISCVGPYLAFLSCGVCLLCLLYCEFAVFPRVCYNCIIVCTSYVLTFQSFVGFAASS